MTAWFDGRYLLVEKLAEGRSAVWRGRDAHGRDVVVKRGPPDLQREAKLLEGVAHRNVVRLLDAGLDADGAWLATEYAAGGSLLAWLERHGRMNPVAAIEVGLQLCSGLAHLHARGIVHRAVAPQKVVVTEGGVCKLIGFGHALRVADPQADVYALSATLHALVRGPGSAPSSGDPREYDGVPQALAEVIRRGTQAAPEQRWPSASAMADALRMAQGVLG